MHRRGGTVIRCRGHAHTQAARGASADQAEVTVGGGSPMRSFKIIREGGMVVIEGTNDRREYEGESFLFMPNGRLLRKYRKLP